MSNNKQTGRGFGSKGYYIALVLCATAIGISGYLYYRNVTDTPSTQVDTTTPSVLAGVTDREDVPVIATQPSDSGSTQPSTENTTPKVFKTMAPVEGETVAEYAMDCLTYNPTTRDWRVHNGVDIAAEAGTKVCAAADGVVYTVYEDEGLGTTVVIRHDDGYVTMYASLDKETAVRPGDTVKLGQTVGHVGNSALLETAVGDHLHFCVTHNDKSVDPAEFLKLG